MAEQNQDVNVQVQPDDPKNFNPTVAKMKNRAEFLSRMTEKGLINEFSGSSLALRENGQANLSAGMYSHIKLNPAGTIDEISMLHSVTTNRFCINSEEFIVNRHKLNPRFFELSDSRDFNTNLLGKFCTDGGILAGTFDAFLGQYMFLRRPSRIALFGPLIKAPVIHPGLHIADPSNLPAETVIYQTTDRTVEQDGGVLGGGIYENYEDRLYSDNSSNAVVGQDNISSNGAGGIGGSSSSGGTSSSGSGSSSGINSSGNPPKKSTYIPYSIPMWQINSRGLGF